MTTSDLMFCGELLWNKWIGTSFDEESRLFYITQPACTVTYRNWQVEQHYPGMSNACEALTAIGCDRTFMTHVLKFCITQGNGEQLDSFLLRTKTLTSAQHALSLGLNGEDLSQLLESSVQASSMATLPEDFGFTA